MDGVPFHSEMEHTGEVGGGEGTHYLCGLRFPTDKTSFSLPVGQNGGGNGERLCLDPLWRPEG